MRVVDRLARAVAIRDDMDPEKEAVMEAVIEEVRAGMAAGWALIDAATGNAAGLWDLQH